VVQGILWQGLQFVAHSVLDSWTRSRSSKTAHMINSLHLDSKVESDGGNNSQYRQMRNIKERSDQQLNVQRLPAVLVFAADDDNRRGGVSGPDCGNNSENIFSSKTPWVFRVIYFGHC